MRILALYFALPFADTISIPIPSIPSRSWLAPALAKAGSSRIAHRTFYSDLYENEGHLFDLHRDEGRPTLTPSSFNNHARPNTQQGHRFSTNHRSAYEVERQMQRVSPPKRQVMSFGAAKELG